MAGSYNHVIDDDGNLGSNYFVIDMLENGGDVFEAVEEMYGMIWYLAQGWVGFEAFPTEGGYEARMAYYDQVKRVVEQARTEYDRGLDISKMIHALSPDRR